MRGAGEGGTAAAGAAIANAVRDAIGLTGDVGELPLTPPRVLRLGAGRRACPVSGGIAFFDVDGTVTRINGMFRFLRYVLSRQDRAAEYDHAMAQLRALTAAGSPREHTNRLYFRLYAGMRWAELLRLGMEWFTVEEAAGAALYNDGAVRALRAHQESGTAVVLVSGSFEPCLGPLAVHLGVSAVECTRPEVTASGRLTGVVRHPMIGAAKAAAVNEVTARSGVDPARCFAYGDHLSDLPMLEAVGHPVAVGTDPGLAERAERAGWLPARRRCVDGAVDPARIH